jgi:hypothetical protein
MPRSNGYRRLLLAAVFISGCGLSEYESKYEKQQARMNYLDQQNLYLGRPIEPPVKKDSKGPTPNVQLRLPVGISTTYEQEPEGILFRYPKVSSKPPPGSNLKYSDLESAYVAVEMNKDWSDFKKRVLATFDGVDPRNVRTVSLEVPGRETRTFETIAFTSGTDPTWSYQFYFFHDDVYRVAIGFRGTDKALTSEAAKQAMEFSVKSLIVGRSERSTPKSSSG